VSEIDMSKVSEMFGAKSEEFNIVVSRDLVEEIIGCIFDCDLSESDSVEYAYNTLNNIDSEEK